MKVLFLDIDGVLNSAEYRNDENVNYYNSFIDESAMVYLKSICEKTSCEIVLTSTRRLYWQEGDAQNDKEGEYINEVFKRFGLKIFSKVPDLDTISRKNEILDWLKTHEAESFVILDDTDFSWGELSSNVVFTDDNDRGLDETTAKKATNILLS